MGEAGPQAGGDRHSALVSRRFLTNFVKIIMKCYVHYCDIILIIVMLQHTVIKVNFQFSQTFGWDLVVLHTILSMSTKFLVHA